MNQTKHGYKQTKVGVIPEDWEEVAVSDFMIERNIQTPKSNEYPLMAFVAYKGVTDKGDRYDREFLVTDEDNKKYKQTEYGDFIYSSNNLETGSIGLNRYGSATISPVYSIFQITKSYDYKFISNFFTTKRFINSMVRFRQGVMYGQWRIHESDFLKIKVIMPTLPEQQKIADILTTWDEAITKQTELLEAKELQKKALMQKLLSGEVRFNGFTDEWENKQINNFMVERNIQTPKSQEYPLMAFVAYKGVTDKGDRYNREFLVTDEDNKKYKQTECGDFIYSSNNLETGSIGLNRYGSATISPVYSIFKITEDCNFEFISNLLITKEFINKMVRYRQGVVYGQWRIHESDFLKIRVNIPSLEEQEKIADILSLSDKEINLLKKELEELNLQKKALMQKLLTGEVRVKV